MADFYLEKPPALHINNIEICMLQRGKNRLKKLFFCFRDLYVNVKGILTFIGGLVIVANYACQIAI
jgi:hypothetical protein